METTAKKDASQAIATMHKTVKEASKEAMKEIMPLMSKELSKEISKDMSKDMSKEHTEFLETEFSKLGGMIGELKLMLGDCAQRIKDLSELNNKSTTVKKSVKATVDKKTTLANAKNVNTINKYHFFRDAVEKDYKNYRSLYVTEEAIKYAEAKDTKLASKKEKEKYYSAVAAAIWGQPQFLSEKAKVDVENDLRDLRAKMLSEIAIPQLTEDDSAVSTEKDEPYDTTETDFDDIPHI